MDLSPASSVGLDPAPGRGVRGALSPEGSALQREPQELAHQVANPVGATRWGDFPLGDHRNVNSVLNVGLRGRFDALSCGDAVRVVYSAALATRRRLP